MRALFFALILIASPVWADEIYTRFGSSKALSGYDPVAYFLDGAPKKGSKKFRFEYKGADWYFSSKKNLELFIAEPSRYEPQYGGHCAWAVGANSARAPGDPKQWKIVDEKLYLNYNRRVQERWLKDIPGFIKKGDENWPKLLAED